MKTGEDDVLSPAQTLEHRPCLIPRTRLPEDLPVEDHDRVRSNHDPLVLSRHVVHLGARQRDDLFFRGTARLLLDRAPHNEEVRCDPGEKLYAPRRPRREDDPLPTHEVWIGVTLEGRWGR